MRMTAKGSTAKPNTCRPSLQAEDVSRMATLMAIHGVTGTAAEQFHALVVAAAEQHQRQAQFMGELNTNLTWFTRRIDDLEQTSQQLLQECDLLRNNQPSSELADQLAAENHRLMAELQQTQQQLTAIQKLLSGTSESGPPGHEQGSQTVSDAMGFPALEVEGGNDQPEEPPATRKARATNLPTSNTVFGLRAELHPNSPKIGHNRLRTDQWLNQIIDALIAWNTAQEQHLSRLRISFPVIKALATLVGASYQAAIQQCLANRAVELSKHHASLGLGSRHNTSVRGKESLLQAIARDYLGLGNWSEVKFV